MNDAGDTKAGRSRPATRSNGDGLDPKRWFKRFDESGWPNFRLYCFPYAGGDANAYRRWASRIDPRIEIVSITMPGRGSRVSEPTSVDFPSLVEDLAAAIRLDAGNMRYAFFGHSMGALMMFEVARKLMNAGARLPDSLFASGRRAPQVSTRSPLHASLDDAEFVAQLRLLQGTPVEILDRPDMLAIFLPLIRSDFALLGSWRFEPSAPLPIPLYAMGGTEDPHAPIDDVALWSNWAGRDFEMLRYPGGHFYLRDQEKQVVMDVGARIVARKA